MLDLERRLIACDRGTLLDAAEYGDLWSLELESMQWKRLAGEPEPLQLCQEQPPAGPEARHSACMWCWGDSLFVFGGAAKQQGVECTFGDLWRFCLTRRRWASVPLRGVLLPMPQHTCGPDTKPCSVKTAAA